MEQTEEGKWLPTTETVEAVRSGNLFVKKIGQVYEIKNKLQEMFKTVTEDSIPQSSHLILARHITDVKNCSIQLDENFEPRKEIIDRVRHVETLEQLSSSVKSHENIFQRQKEENSMSNLNQPGHDPDDERYIHSDEFKERFGDWEKVNRLEKLRKSTDLEFSSSITIEGNDITDLVDKLRSNYSKENLKQLQDITRDIGQEKIAQLRKKQKLDEYAPLLLTNRDTGRTLILKSEVINEIDRHNFFTKGHIEAVQEIDKLIKESIYIGSEKNEDNRDPTLKEFFYFSRGIKINNENYTAKCVFVLNNKNELYYDQNLSEIEKGKIIETILNKNMLGASSPLQKGADSFEQVRQEFPDKYYDRRLNRICQVPQMPYLEYNEETNQWQPTTETIEAVRSGNLFIKRIGQVDEMQDNRIEESQKGIIDREIVEVNNSEILQFSKDVEKFNFDDSGITDPVEIEKHYKELDNLVEKEKQLSCIGFIKDSINYAFDSKKYNRPNIQNYTKNQHLIGVITRGNGEDESIYTDKESYINAIKESLDNGEVFSRRTITNDPEVHKAIDDMMHGQSGEMNPHSLEFYEKMSHKIDSQKQKKENSMSNVNHHEHDPVAGIPENFDTMVEQTPAKNNQEEMGNMEAQKTDKMKTPEEKMNESFTSLAASIKERSTEERKNEFQENVRETIVTAIKNRRAPWQKENDGKIPAPYNPISGERYQKFTRVWLDLNRELIGSEDPRWLSMSAMKKNNLYPKEGSKSVIITYPKKDENGEYQNSYVHMFNGSQVKDMPPLEMPEEERSRLPSPPAYRSSYHAPQETLKTELVNYMNAQNTHNEYHPATQNVDPVVAYFETRQAGAIFYTVKDADTISGRMTQEAIRPKSQTRENVQSNELGED